MLALPASDEAFLRGPAAAMDGLLTHDEARYLHQLAADGPGRGAIVEIGSYHGKSTVILARAAHARARERVVAIDPFRGGNSPVFRANLAETGMAERVEALVARSEDVALTWTTPVRLLWIDGGHQFEQVHLDVTRWIPHLLEDGVIAFHDSFVFPGVRQVIAETVLRDRRFRLVGVVDSITAVRRLTRPTPTQRVRDRLLRIGHALYAGRNGKPLLRGSARKGLKRGLKRLSTPG